MEFNGILTALITPFSKGEPDLRRYEALCRRQLEAGVHGLVACGTTGETPTLTENEWLDCVTCAVGASAGRVPVVAGCGTNDTESSSRRIQLAAEAGADAALVVLPYYNKPPPAGLRKHVERCASLGFPLVLYHVPGRTALKVSPRLLAELCAIRGVVAVKDATGDANFAGDLLAATDVPVLSGDDGTLLPLLALGAAGGISVLSNVAPAATVELYRCARGGDMSRARSLHYRLLPLVRWLFHTSSPIPCKAIMAAGGLCSPDMRLPLVALGSTVPPDLLPLLEA